MPGVSQTFINLLNLPMGQLRDIAEELDVSVPAGARKWDLVRELSKAPTKKIAPRASGWIFAGRTSVTYVRLGDGNALEEEKVVEALTDLCDGTNPLEANVRPDSLSRTPTLIDAMKDGNRIFLNFGVKKPVAQVLSDFEIETVEADDFFVAVIRLDKAVIEIRTNHERAERFATKWISGLDDLLFADADAEDEDEGEQEGLSAQ